MANSKSSRQGRIGHRIKLRDLEILLEVVRWGSMAKAAVPLAMSQPAISEAIAGTEGTLGIRLLDRGPQGVTPTVYAQALLRRADIAFDELRQGLREIEFLATPGAGEVRIGCPESLSAGFVAEIVARLSHQFPKVSVRVIAAQPGEQEFRELRERTVDLLLGRVFRPLAGDDVSMDVLCDDAFFVVAGANNPLARRSAIKLEDLHDERWVLFPDGSLSNAYIREAFSSNGADFPEPAVSSYSMQLRFHLLASAGFLTVLHGSVLVFNAEAWSLRKLPINLRIRPMPIAIFTLKNRTLSPVVQLFIEQAHKIASAMGGDFVDTRDNGRR
jgi:DNA-binding transcriptional LysR family regulator